MTLQSGPSRLAIAFAAFAICAAELAGASGTTDQAKADEIAIRHLLATLEQQINRGDLGFVNVFAKDAVIIAPGAPDVVGFNAIRALYAGLMQQNSLTVHFSTQEVVALVPWGETTS
ncbi:MAG TPA: nuclear transport factor 2 family protein [Bryobacteraceae bacterium]|nr:nuclear transport factor 2 family protein [Bryobacteraceae bacterium]